MDTYTDVSIQLSRILTTRYSTSFGLSTRLFPRNLRRAIYAVYGFVRVADEIVDTFDTLARQELLDAFEEETYVAMKRGVSTNPIIHAFIVTANEFDIDKTLIHPFFESMRMDLEPATYTRESYQRYIYGSAEVVGLMCLKVFVRGDASRYDELREGASALGAAYQKVNFLRDMKDDFESRGRVYFPEVDYKTFNDSRKKTIVEDIEHDFAMAKEAIKRLPRDVRPAVMTSYRYYMALLDRLRAASAQDIQKRRLRVPDAYKLWLFTSAYIMRGIA